MVATNVDQAGNAVYGFLSKKLKPPTSKKTITHDYITNVIGNHLIKAITAMAKAGKIDDMVEFYNGLVPGVQKFYANRLYAGATIIPSQKLKKYIDFYFQHEQHEDILASNIQARVINALPELQSVYRAYTNEWRTTYHGCKLIQPYFGFDVAPKSELYKLLYYATKIKLSSPFEENSKSLPIPFHPASIVIAAANGTVDLGAFIHPRSSFAKEYSAFPELSYVANFIRMQNLDELVTKGQLGCGEHFFNTFHEELSGPFQAMKLSHHKELSDLIERAASFKALTEAVNIINSKLDALIFDLKMDDAVTPTKIIATVRTKALLLRQSAQKLDDMLAVIVTRDDGSNWVGSEQQLKALDQLISNVLCDHKHIEAPDSHIMNTINCFGPLLCFDMNLSNIGKAVATLITYPKDVCAYSKSLFKNPFKTSLQNGKFSIYSYARIMPTKGMTLIASRPDLSDEQRFLLVRCHLIFALIQASNRNTSLLEEARELLYQLEKSGFDMLNKDEEPWEKLFQDGIRSSSTLKPLLIDDYPSWSKSRAFNDAINEYLVENPNHHDETIIPVHAKRL